jgi:hypothetical protein
MITVGIKAVNIRINIKREPVPAWDPVSGGN